MTSKKLQHLILRCFASLILFLTIASNLCRGQTNAPAPLSPAAQEAVEKGITAAKLPDYPLAISCFEEARKLAPEAPVIYLNLGLAESKIPGRELRAMAWFGAYLAAYSDAPNAAAVKEQIAVLDEKNQTAVSRLLTTVQDAADKIAGDSRSEKLASVTQLWLDFGDIAAARRTAALIRGKSKDDKETRSKAEAHIAAANGDFEGARKVVASELAGCRDRIFLIWFAKQQVATGNLAGAKKTLADAAKIACDFNPDPSVFHGLQAGWARIAQIQVGMVDEQIEAGDIAGANKIADQIISKKGQNVSSYKSSTLANIALAHAKNGAIASVKKSLVAAEAAAGLIEIDDDFNRDQRDQVHRSITKAQAMVGDMAEAQKVADSIEDGWIRAEAIEDIAVAQAKAGDSVAANNQIASAQKTIDRILKPKERSSALIELAEVQLNIGDKPGAKATTVAAQAAADTISSDDDKRAALASIVNLRLKLGPSSSAVPWLKNLDDDSKYDECPLNSAPVLDLTGYLKSLPTDNPDQIFDGVFDAAKQITSARQVITKMLKQQAQPPAKP